MRLIDATKYAENIQLIMACWNCSSCLSPSEANRATDNLKVALNELSHMPTIDPVHAAGGTYCHECYWFNPSGYENPDPEMPELQMGWCGHWRRDTQACNFCNRGMTDSAGGAGTHSETTGCQGR